MPGCMSHTSTRASTRTGENPKYMLFGAYHVPPDSICFDFAGGRLVWCLVPR